MFSSFSANLPFIQVLCGADYHTHINTCFCLLRYAKSSQKISTSLSLSSSPRRRVWIFDVTSKVQRHITQLFCYCSGSLHCFSETQLTRVVKPLFLTTIHIAADITFSIQTYWILGANALGLRQLVAVSLFSFLKPILFTFAATSVWYCTAQTFRC